MIEHIPMNCDLLIVGLNVSNDSANKGNLWSTSRAPWNLWKSSGIFKDYNSDITKASKTCNEEPYTTGLKVGFTDLIDEINTDSKKVQGINKPHIDELINKIITFKVKNVCLLGDKVIDGFVDNFQKNSELLKIWNDLKSTKVNGTKFHVYGKLGEIILNNKTVFIFGMPFPTTVPISKELKVSYFENMNNTLNKTKNMLSKIKEWFVSLPVECQVELAYLNGQSLITGKYKDDPKNSSLEAFLKYMELDGLSYEEVLKRTLILYSVIDMIISLKLSLNWNIPQNLIAVSYTHLTLPTKA